MFYKHLLAPYGAYESKGIHDFFHRNIRIDLFTTVLCRYDSWLLLRVTPLAAPAAASSVMYTRSTNFRILRTDPLQTEHNANSAYT